MNDTRLEWHQQEKERESTRIINWNCEITTGAAKHTFGDASSDMSVPTMPDAEPL